MDQITCSHELLFDNGKLVNGVITGYGGSGYVSLLPNLLSSLKLRSARSASMCDAVVLSFSNFSEETCSRVGAELIRLSKNNSFTLNPLAYFESSDLESAARYIMAMAGLTTQGREDVEHVTHAIKLTKALHGSTASLTGLQAYCQDHDNAVLRDLALGLEPFTEHGDYGSLFTTSKSLLPLAGLSVIDFSDIRIGDRLECLLMILVLKISSLPNINAHAQRVVIVEDLLMLWAGLDDVSALCVPILDQIITRGNDDDFGLWSRQIKISDFEQNVAGSKLIQSADTFVYLTNSIDTKNDQAAHDNVPAAELRVMVSGLNSSKQGRIEMVTQRAGGQPELVKLRV